MATRTKPGSEVRYEQDFYAWSKAQADPVRAGRSADLDLDHLSGEVEDLADALERSARHRIRTIVEHLLKLRYAPAQDPRAGWRATVRSRGVKLRDGLTASLRTEVENELSELYADARGMAEGSMPDHGEHAAADALPATCPYSPDQITGDWLP
jgi:hypothetical protein